MSIADEEFDKSPRKSGRKKKNKGGKQGSPVILYALLGGGVLFFLLVCCIGGSVGAYLIFLAGPGDPEKAIVGTWKFDGDYGFHVTIGSPATLQFNSDGSFETISADPTQSGKGKWKTLSKDGNIIKVEITNTVVTKFATRTVTTSVEFVVVSRSELRRPDHPNLRINGQRVLSDSGQRYKRI